MNRYLAIVGDESGRWLTIGEHAQAYVFKAQDDNIALEVILSYLNDTENKALEFLGCITGGLQIQGVPIPDKTPESSVSKLSLSQQKEVNFTRLFIGEHMISKLQSFDPEKGRK